MSRSNPEHHGDIAEQLQARLEPIGALCGLFPRRPWCTHALPPMRAQRPGNPCRPCRMRLFDWSPKP
jgi:hypothetical protein